jgi:hypothetical protein
MDGRQQRDRASLSRSRKQHQRARIGDRVVNTGHADVRGCGAPNEPVVRSFSHKPDALLFELAREIDSIEQLRVPTDSRSCLPDRSNLPDVLDNRIAVGRSMEACSDLLKLRFELLDQPVASPLTFPSDFEDDLVEV